MHFDEYTFQDYVEELLIDQYGEDNVYREKYYPETGRFVDFYVETAVVNLALEVENDAEAIMKGAGQAVLYANHDSNTVGAVVVPKGHIDQPETNLLRQDIPIVELEVDGYTDES